MSGTLLSDLDNVSSTMNNDDNVVQRIINEMNTTPTPQQQLQPPQVQTRQPPAPQVIQAPNPNTTIQHSMDSASPTAHMIGNEHPTNADFAAMMYGGGRQQQPYMNQQYAPVMAQPHMYQPPLYKHNWYSNIADEVKTPILVSLLFFVFSLPFISVLISHYFPSFVKGTGELTTFGLLLKSVLAGALFWVLHRIIAPLLINS
jgi:hypothetical protein